jgi:hypothetical protein
MEKWFKDMIDRKLKIKQQKESSPKGAMQKVLAAPENYSKKTQDIAMKIFKGKKNANNR